MTDKNTYSKRYTDEELRAKAICTMKYINEKNDAGMEVVLSVAMRTGMHPQVVVQEIQRLAAIQL